MEEMLTATPLPDTVAIGKGIKRGADKVLQWILWNYEYQLLILNSCR